MNEETQQEIIKALDKVIRRKKSQFVRVLDVLILGPILIFAAKRSKKGLPLTEGMNRAIELTGWGTIFYNGWNFFRVMRAEKELKALAARANLQLPESTLNFK